MIVCLLAGCNGVWLPPAVEPSTAQSRIEAEFIPNAALVREDTLPRWPLGRYAFGRGTDRLLVVSHVTSFENRVDGSESHEGLDRVWITLPLRTRVGEPLSLADLEARFLVGYDAGQLGDEIFVQPTRVTGTVTLMQEGLDVVVVDLNMRVAPNRLPELAD